MTNAQKSLRELNKKIRAKNRLRDKVLYGNTNNYRRTARTKTIVTRNQPIVGSAEQLPGENQTSDGSATT